MIPEFTLLFFNISGGEILIILLIVFLVFGPSKIPEVARSLGRMMNEVKKASSDISREFRKGTSEMESEFRKTTDRISDTFKPLSDDPIGNVEVGEIKNETEEIPDVYLKNNSSEPKAENPDESQGENSENPYNN